jgi:tryptophan synthase alpha chain
VSDRIARRFAALRAEGRAGLVTFVTAGDPDPATGARILAGLPAAGADVIELGMPFSDPMADGPAIQAGSQRALKAGQTMKRTLAMVRAFRGEDRDTPIVLMGYYNPIYIWGAEKFVTDALDAGADGVIIVDLPPEEDPEFSVPAARAGLAFVRLVTPTSDDARIAKIVERADGFIYYVAVAGITGTKSAAIESVQNAVGRIRRATKLPVAVGFGIKTPEQAADIARVADAAVVGSAIVERIAAGGADVAGATLGLVQSLAAAVRSARARQTAAAR